MKTLVLIFSIFLSTISFAKENIIYLECSSGGNNAYAFIIDVGNQSLHISAYNGLNFGSYPQINSNNRNTLVFYKKPVNENNGIPFLIEIPIKLLNSNESSAHSLNVRVTQNWPGPINENVFYNNLLKCTKMN